ncbi:MAG: tRNA1(Val) (adenine(37)-N6)-methyltransferase [Bacteroidales bacterium]
MGKSFQFKQFTVADDNSTMKIGTDAVLLGSWSNIENAEHILDIGSGSGIIALMLAQRSNAFVDAVEIDKNSAQQACQNFKLSPWKSKMKVYHTSFQDFSGSNTSFYDLIISNPPFFEKALKSEVVSRNLARHTDTLSYEDLMKGISKRLSPKGKACIILPVTESISLIPIAESLGLHCNYQTEVISKKGMEASRKLMEFSKIKTELKVDSICILNDDLNYTEEFKSLTKKFYLKF